MSGAKFRSANIPRSIEAFAEKQIPTSEELECEKRGYKLTRTTLGRGAYAKVKLAYATPAKIEKDKKLKQILKEQGDNKVAIKIISKKSAPAEYLTKFLPREIETLNTVCGCENVIKLYESFRSENRVYLVMEYANQGDLLEFINNKASKIPGIGEAKAKEFFRQLAEGMDHCHRRNVVHRDLKCENILIHDQNLIKISDFGFATRFPTARQPLLETFCGSYAYAAPEILQAEKYDGKIADIWSLGIILFAMLNGRLPFSDKDIPTLLDQTKGNIQFSSRVQLSAECKDLVKRILTANLRKRITLVDILRHPWLEQTSSREVLQESLSRGVPDGESEKLIVSTKENAKMTGVNMDGMNTAEMRTESSNKTNDRCKPKQLNREIWTDRHQTPSAMVKLLVHRHKEQCATKPNKVAMKYQVQDESPMQNSEAKDHRLTNDAINNQSTAQTEKIPTTIRHPIQQCFADYRYGNGSQNASKCAESAKKSKNASKYEVKEGNGRKVVQTQPNWNEIKMPVSNLKTNGFYRIFYPGLIENGHSPGEFNLPPVGNGCKNSSKNPATMKLKTNNDCRQPKSSKKQQITASPHFSNCSTITTEIINLRRNWRKGTTKTNGGQTLKENLLTFYTLSGKEVKDVKEGKR